MKVAGLGFRHEASLASLRDALQAVGDVAGLAALATISDKADASVLKSLAAELGLPIKRVAVALLADIETVTVSEVVRLKFGTGSVAEAAAIAAAGRGARLIARRAVSPDRMATAAIAEGDGE